jgi:hypothetical protein
MNRRPGVRLIVCVCALALSSSGCSTVRDILGYGPSGDPSVTIRSTEPRWLLIKNPRFGDVASEPEYVWVEEDKLPFTMKSLVLGKKSLIAPPEVVAKYGAPPGGGRISPRQGGPYQVQNMVPVAPTTRGPVAAATPSTRTDGGGAALPHRGFVVYVDTTRVVIDLTAQDGVRPGSIVSVRRDKIAIVHPITGELLGELDEEVATGKVSEVRDKFSVVDIENLPSGAQVRVKDRVVVR